MKRILRIALEQPFYPWLAGILPILHLYKYNLDLVIDSEVIPSIALMLLGTSIAFLRYQSSGSQPATDSHYHQPMQPHILT